MSDRPDVTNTVQAGVTARSTQVGDVPDALRRRYLTEAGRGGAGIAYYVDATIMIPSFHDRGRELIATRADRTTIRDLVAIAQHRGWSSVQVRGAVGFRREAWMAGRLAGLEVDGYRPGERDLQLLQRRLDGRARYSAPEPEGPETEAGLKRGRQRTVAPSPGERQRIVETVVRHRVANLDDRTRILSAARNRIAEGLERGALFDPPAPAREAHGRAPERHR